MLGERGTSFFWNMNPPHLSNRITFIGEIEQKAVG